MVVSHKKDEYEHCFRFVEELSLPQTPTFTWF